MTKEEMKNQKGIKQVVKADAAKSELKKGKQDLIDLLGLGKGPISLKVYRDDGSDEIIQNFKASDLHLVEWKEVMDACHKRIEAG
ncbi:hypothetical protein Tco_0974663 [Tanacetum coccineum]|uniref:Uncharacterized protein n=1 Tax=Tanacetum coccineum TaxID=301880 RepID=A0ABQ5ECD9_9ASTR